MWCDPGSPLTTTPVLTPGTSPWSWWCGMFWLSIHRDWWLHSCSQLHCSPSSSSALTPACYSEHERWRCFQPRKYILCQFTNIGSSLVSQWDVLWRWRLGSCVSGHPHEDTSWLLSVERCHCSELSESLPAHPSTSPHLASPSLIWSETVREGLEKWKNSI